MASFFSHDVKVDNTIFDKVNNDYQSSVRESILKCSYFHFGPLDTDTHRIRIKQINQKFSCIKFLCSK
jgi:hypothetical protein